MSENQEGCPHCGGITEEHAVLIARREWVKMMAAWREREEDRAALKREYHRKIEALRDPVAELLGGAAYNNGSLVSDGVEAVLSAEALSDPSYRS